MNLFERISNLFSVPRRARLGMVEDDNTFTAGPMAGSEKRDRYDYDREEMLRLSLEAWRVNPLARRIVGLSTQYVVGGGMRVSSDHEASHRFLEEFWDHRLNQLGLRVYEWCDELSRAGELFLVVSTDAAGMSYLRAIPALDIEEIETAANDLAQEVSYLQKANFPPEDERLWQAYDELSDLQNADGSFAPVMLHYAINRPVGALRGESDLAPLLRWLSRYASWLEDRARLNRFRNSFLFVVKARFNSEAERLARQAALTLSPPSPGSILVTDETEEWSCINPNLQSSDANEDGLALKKMIAVGAGVPLHFLAEPEGSNRSTADSAGGPTYRYFEQRQEFFSRLMEDVCRVALTRREKVDSRIDAGAKVKIQGADLSARDNASLAVATSTVTAALIELRKGKVIDDVELLRMIYRFAGEVADVETLLANGKKAEDWSVPVGTGPVGTGAAKAGRPAGVRIDPDTGEAGGVAEIK